MFFRSLSHKAFTLIELLIVIIIIGILATALIPRFTGAQNKARYARVEKDFRDFRTAVFLAQTNTNSSLRDITQSNQWSNCFMTGTNLRTISSNHACRNARRTNLRKIESAAGMDTGSLSSLETDPWGSPYLFDDNEGDPFYSGCGAFDTLHTVGVDGLLGGINWSNALLTVGDNKGINIPPMGCPGAY